MSSKGPSEIKTGHSFSFNRSITLSCWSFKVKNWKPFPHNCLSLMDNMQAKLVPSTGICLGGKLNSISLSSRCQGLHFLCWQCTQATFLQPEARLFHSLLAELQQGPLKSVEIPTSHKRPQCIAVYMETTANEASLNLYLDQPITKGLW